MLTREAIYKKLFIADLRAQILRVAFELTGDKTYTREEAAAALIKITEQLDYE